MTQKREKFWFTPLPNTRFFEAGHQEAAEPVHLLIVVIFGILASMCIGAGIIAIIWNAVSKTEFKLFGAHLTTGRVGVAFVGIGLLTFLFIVRAVLKNQRDLAKLPPDVSEAFAAKIDRGKRDIAEGRVRTRHDLPPE